MSLDLETLNAAQKEAVLCTEGPLLVLAGAGSGKTRVLTYRIAHLIDDLQVAPWQIMAITFTNKAANEMRERLAGLVGVRSRGMWVSTFHSMCVRILRADAEAIGFTRNFTIYDTDDSKRLVKELMAELDINPKIYPLNMLMNRISDAKNNLVVPRDYEAEANDPVGRTTARLYVRLQERLRAANAFDFDDLLLYTYLLLKHHPEILAAYQQRFRYFSVDEYQDTNHAQYAITKMLARASQNLMVVGDDDQSIYSWRGADIRNILEFEKDYPSAHVVKLEQNYRSTGTILDAANAVIANNRQRKQKKLFTAQGPGEKVKVFMASDERDEGRWIASEIEKRHLAGTSYQQMALFYRTNAQSRILEDMLVRAGVPYRIVGGTRFFDRQEIRDAMSYLSLAVNPADDLAAKRVINVPRRGIGKTTIAYIEQQALMMGVGFFEAAELSIADGDLRAATRKALADFCNIIRTAQGYEGELRALVEMIIDRSGLIASLEAERSDEALGRIENLKEFFGVADEFAQTHDTEEVFFEAPTAVSGDAEQEGEEPARVLRGDSLADFVEWVRLRTDLDAVSVGDAAVTLMTIHSAKGLEFDDVWVAGMEETLFPHFASVMDNADSEEERRLAYVAITRARKRLCLACAATRQLFGQTHANPPSRFLREIPEELRQTVGVGSSGFSGTGWEKRGSRRGISGSGTEAQGGRVIGRASSSGASRSGRASGAFAGDSKAGKKAAASVSFHAGDAVEHKTFGRGTVKKVDGDKLTIRFSSGQTKTLLKDYAPLIKL